MRPGKILMVYIEPTPYIVNFVKELSARWPGSIDVLFATENLSQNWDIQLNGFSFEVLSPGNKAIAIKLWKVLRHGDYQVVHLAGWGHTLFFAAMVLARFKNTPIVMETDTPLPYVLAKWKKIVKKLIYPMMFRFPKKFLPGGKRQATYLRHYGVPDEHITIAQMTVDVRSITKYVSAISEKRQVFLREKLGIPSTATVFLYVGRMEPHKGLRVLIDAFTSLCKRRHVAYLLLVGDGTMREDVNRAVKNNAEIRYQGRLSGNELLDAYAVADVFVLPSLFEPWGLVVNEAMAAGLPVIVSDRVGCVDDLVISGETGLVIPAESELALTEAMQMLLDNKAARREMAVSARRHIKPWTPTNKASIVMRCWTEVAACSYVS